MPYTKNGLLLFCRSMFILYQLTELPVSLSIYVTKRLMYYAYNVSKLIGCKLFRHSKYKTYLSCITPVSPILALLNIMKVSLRKHHVQIVPNSQIKLHVTYSNAPNRHRYVVMKCRRRMCKQCIILS